MSKHDHNEDARRFARQMFVALDEYTCRSDDTALKACRTADAMPKLVKLYDELVGPSNELTYPGERTQPEREAQIPGTNGIGHKLWALSVSDARRQLREVCWNEPEAVVLTIARLRDLAREGVNKNLTKSNKGACHQLAQMRHPQCPISPTLLASLSLAYPARCKETKATPHTDGRMLLRYPITGPNAMTGAEAYRKIHNKWTGEYGENRRAYCGWLAGYIENVLIGVMNVMPDEKKPAIQRGITAADDRLKTNPDELPNGISEDERVRSVLEGERQLRDLCRQYPESVKESIELLLRLSESVDNIGKAWGACTEVHKGNVRTTCRISTSLMSLLSLAYPVRCKRTKAHGSDDVNGGFYRLAYPVPGPDGMTGEEAYKAAIAKWSGEYGANRRRYCGWLAGYISEVFKMVEKGE